MKYIFTVSLIALSLLMVFWGLKKKERFFQFPTLFGGAWLLFIVPQLIGLLASDTSLPYGVEKDGGLLLALIMANLSAVLGFWGYVLPVKKRKTRYFKQYSDVKIFRGGCALLLVGYGALFLLMKMCGGFFGYYSVEGHYDLIWTGMPVILVFFTKLIYPGLMLCLLETLKKPSSLRWFLVSMSMTVPIANIFLLGRRSEFFLFFLIIGVSLFFRKGWAPKRYQMILAFLLGGFVILVAPLYREYSQIGGDFSKIYSIDPKKEFYDQISGDKYSEFKYAVVQISATNTATEFGYGRGFYNNIIALWVPKVLVGAEIKKSLMMSTPKYSGHTLNYYDWSSKYGSFPTGINQAFCEFWLLGGFVFFFIGRFYKKIWIITCESLDTILISFYGVLLPWAMKIVVADVYRFPSEIFYFFIFMYPVYRYSIKKKKVLF